MLNKKLLVLLMSFSSQNIYSCSLSPFGLFSSGKNNNKSNIYDNIGTENDLIKENQPDDSNLESKNEFIKNLKSIHSEIKSKLKNYSNLDCYINWSKIEESDEITKRKKAILTKFQQKIMKRRKKLETIQKNLMSSDLSDEEKQQKAQKFKLYLESSVQEGVKKSEEVFLKDVQNIKSQTWKSIIKIFPSLKSCNIFTTSDNILVNENFAVDITPLVISALKNKLKSLDTYLENVVELDLSGLEEFDSEEN